MSGLWTMSGVTFLLSCLLFVAALFKLPPGRNYSPWMRLTFVLLSISTGVTSGASLFGVSGSTGATLNLVAMALAIAGIVSLYWTKRTPQ